MSALGGLFTGILTKVIAMQGFDASSAEGFLAYTIGFTFGWLLVREARDKR